MGIQIRTTEKKRKKRNVHRHRPEAGVLGGESKEFLLAESDQG